MKIAAYYETARYAFYVMRAGASIVRKFDEASVYIQPGDDTQTAINEVDACVNAREAWDGENNQVFDHWCSQYF